MVEYSERLTTAMQAAGISVSRLASALDLSYQGVKKVCDGKSKSFSAANNVRAAEILGVSAAWLATGEGSMDFDLMHMPQRVSTQPREVNLDDNPDYPAVRRVKIKASAGVLGINLEQDVEDGAPIVFRKTWYEKYGYKPSNMLAVTVVGQSMEPTLWEDDLIVVNMASKEPKDGRVFLVVYEGETGVKRLMRDAGQWWLTSDNHDSRRFPRKVCHEDTNIIGEVVYKQSQRI